jgi:hypothetical protein
LRRPPSARRKGGATERSRAGGRRCAAERDWRLEARGDGDDAGDGE